MTTLAQSFYQNLPVLDHEVPSGRLYGEPHRKLHASASSTSNQDAPRALEPMTALDLINRATTNMPQGVQVQPPSPTGYFPGDEDSFYLQSEADVVRAAAVYLIHPVNMAMRALCPPGIKIRCSAEKNHSNTSRTDLIWTLCIPQHNIEAKFAILEFKNLYMLHKQDFDNATANMTPGHQKSPRLLIERSYTAGDKHSFLRGNGMTAVQQASKYQEATDAPNDIYDIAIFDWLNMCILDYEGINDSRTNPKLVKILFLKQSRNNQGPTFRMVLYAMLCQGDGQEAQKPLLEASLKNPFFCMIA